MILSYFGEANISQTNPTCCDICLGQNLSPPLDYTLVERLRKDRVITEILGNNIESLIMKSMEEYELRLA